jgi:N,N'-diacetyllegionaminate synthase
MTIAARAMGAVALEKHFTLDRGLKGPDHKASLEPDELKSMVDAIRNIEKAMGDGVKRPAISEKSNIDIARKSIVANKEIKKGQIFSENNITTKRPGTGTSPMEWDFIIGKVAKRDYKIDDFCIPYIVKKDDLDILLKKNDAIDKPPEHMYT